MGVQVKPGFFKELLEGPIAILEEVVGVVLVESVPLLG